MHSAPYENDAEDMATVYDEGYINKLMLLTSGEHSHARDPLPHNSMKKVMGTMQALKNRIMNEIVRLIRRGASRHRCQGKVKENGDEWRTCPQI